jgi:hypothetical protein
MRTPPFLLGASLLFWGWQTDFLLPAVLMAIILEMARFVPTKWELSNDDFSRIWTFCSVLFLATGAYAFTSNGGPGDVSRLISGGVRALAQNSLGKTSVRTSVLVIRWLPMVFFLFIAAQAWSNREGIPLETISLILRRRWKQAKKEGRPLPPSRVVNVSYPYFIVCIFAACSHAPADNNTFFWGVCALLAWGLWPRRSQRFSLAIWAAAMAVTIALGYEGMRGMVLLKQKMDQFSPQWLAGLVRAGASPFESRTEIGQVGRIKTSGQIVIRVKTPTDSQPPTYLREASYRSYNSSVWYGSRNKDDFSQVSERPPNSGTWPLVLSKTNDARVNIACYLPGGSALLPLPGDSGRLEQLPAFILYKSTLGAVRAQGPGLVIFNAEFGHGPVMDSAPDQFDDLIVTERERPALDQVIQELGLKDRDPETILAAVSRFFETKFTYSLWQEKAPKQNNNDPDSSLSEATRATLTAMMNRHLGTNITQNFWRLRRGENLLSPLGRFLLRTRSGHCEYFATATVLLLRELGIPARYTVGYYVHEPAGSRNYVVRQSDAHAWCRVWNARAQTWEDFDTTPSSWIGVEHERRSAFQFLSDAWSRVFFEFSKFRWGQSNLRQILLWTIVPILILLLYQIIFRSKRRRAAPKSATAARPVIWPGLDSEFYQLENLLTRKGHARQPNEPLYAWLNRNVSDPALARFNAPLRQILSLHYKYRFDPAGIQAAERETLRSEVARCLSIISAKS